MRHVRLAVTKWPDIRTPDLKLRYLVAQTEWARIRCERLWRARVAARVQRRITAKIEASLPALLRRQAE